MRVSGALASTRRIAHVSLVCAHILDACESGRVCTKGEYTHVWEYKHVRRSMNVYTRTHKHVFHEHVHEEAMHLFHKRVHVQACKIQDSRLIGYYK